MNWYKDLYVSENISGSRKYLEFMVDHGFSVRPMYLITLSNLTDAQLEIIPVSLLKVPFFKQENWDIVGVAKGYYHARSLVERIYSDVLEETGDVLVKDYFKEAFALDLDAKKE